MEEVNNPSTPNAQNADLNNQPTSNPEPNFSGVKPPTITQNVEPNIYPSGTSEPSYNYSDDSLPSGTRYLTLYAIGIGLLAGILSSLASLLEVCFNYVGQQGNDSSGDWLSGYTLKFLLWLVASLLITVPLYVLILLKTKNYHIQDFTRATRRVRNFLYGFFMTLLGLATAWSLVSVIYSVIVQFAPKDEYSTETAWWAGLIQAILTSLIFGATFFFKLKKEQ